MKTKNFTPMGSLHPVLFFVFVYVVVLFFSIFICSSLFYSCNVGSAGVSVNSSAAEGPDLPASSTVASRK